MAGKKWALIGAGVIAKEWIAGAIRAQPDHRIECVLSSDRARGTAFAKDLGIPRAYDSIDEMFARESPDAVYISTTNEKHAGQCIAAAAAGAHVLCDKPLALRLADAREMVESCRAAGVTLAVNHHLRADAAHEKMRDLVAAGAIGKPLAARVFHTGHLPPHLRGWRLDSPAKGGGAILDLTVHNADAVAFSLGEYPRAVVAVDQRAGLARAGLEDGCMSVWRFDSGAHCLAHESFALPQASTGMEIHGETGSLIGIDVMRQKPVGRVILRDGKGEREIETERRNLYARSLSFFARAMEGDGRPLADGADGCRSLAVALAVREAARGGRETKVDYGAFAPA